MLGVLTKDLCRRHGFSEARRLRALEAKNGRLKRLLAEATLAQEVTPVCQPDLRHLVFEIT